MSYRFRPSSRPNGYTYTLGYPLVATGPIGIVASAMHSDWRWLLLGIGSLAFAVCMYALLGWWRERYDELHPEEVDFNSERVDKWLDAISLRTVRAVAGMGSRSRRDRG